MQDYILIIYMMNQIHFILVLYIDDIDFFCKCVIK